MAKKDDEKSNFKLGPLKRLAGLLQNNSDELYKSTYYSDPSNNKMLKDLKTSIDTSIKDIMDTNIDNTGEPNISKLYERIFMKTQNDDSTVKEFERIFGDNEFINNLSNSYLDNRWIRAIDDEIDDTLRYMPKLQEALETLRDNVLAADSFSKDYLTIKKQLDDSYDKPLFNMHVEEIKKKYDLVTLIDELYFDTSKYGESFVYCVPYQKAIQNLLDTKNDNRAVAIRTNFKEGTVIIEDGIETQSKNIMKNDLSLNYEYNSGLENPSNINVNFEIRSGIIESIVKKEQNARTVLTEVQQESLCEQFFNEMGLSEASSIENDGKKFKIDNISSIEPYGKLPTHHKFDSTLNDNMELPNSSDTAADGLININKANSGRIKSINGCIVKKLDRDKVTPIILNDICLGYYYFEFDPNMSFIEDRYPSTGMVNTITGLRSNGRSEAFDAMQRRDELVRYLASELAARIDAKFVDANQNLKREIYYILKSNDEFNNNTDTVRNVRVTYIPPEDIHHLYFKLDPKTHRGISDLALALIPAKLWVAIYVTNCLAVMTRGNDKRVYYVRQSVESNIAKTLLKTINEIKKSNFGIRQLESINNVLNITGRFNDYIIPRGSDGQSPVDFEVMQGQQIEIKTELLNLLEESAINSTKVPLELIQMRQSPEYATQLTMSNSKFLRFAYKRQAEVQELFSPLITKIYDLEYTVNDQIIMTLPPPLFINVTNTNQLIINTTEYCDSIVNIRLGDSTDDNLRAKFGKKLKMYYLGSYLDTNIIEDLLNKAQQELAREEASKTEDELNNDNNY